MRVTPTRTGREGGSAFVVVLWFAVAASGLGLALLETSRGALPEARREIETIRLRAAVASAVHATAARIAADELAFRAGTATLTWDFDGIVLSVRARAESGLVDLTAASFGLLRQLAEATGFEREAARSLVANFARKKSQLGGREDEEREEPGPFAEFRPPARPGVDHPVEFLGSLPIDVMTVAPRSTRLLALVTLGSGLPEPVAELAPFEVRKALAGTRDSSERAAALERAQEAANVRRRDPHDLYRLEIVARTAEERFAVRRVSFALRPDDARPVRIIDWSAAIVAPTSGEDGRDP